MCNVEKKRNACLREWVIGDRKFYSRVAKVAVPMIIQNTLSNVVSLLDNIMVGQVGTIPMSAVAIVNQMIFVFYVCVWGSTAGAGIFGAQFFGRKDYEGVRVTLRFKLIIGFLLATAAGALFMLFGQDLIGLFISAGTPAAERTETLEYAGQYLRVMIMGLFPFSISQCYSGTLRETGKTMLPMKAGIAAMVINFIFNSLLIFGLFGFPKLGVEGAAIATVISRVAELVIIVYGAHRNEKRYPFLKGLFRHFYIPKELAFRIAGKTLPLLMNEFLWSFGQAALLQCYSFRGISVVAALNIAGTVAQIFNEIFLSLGNATGILVGQELGADRMDDAKHTAWRMMAFSVTCCIFFGMVLYSFAPLIPQIYNTTPAIRLTAADCIRVLSLCMPIFGLANASYFTVRSGGRVLITFLFDSCFSWVCSIPAAYFLTHRTQIAIVTVYLMVNLLELIKDAIGVTLVKKGVWIRNIVKK
jgi:putative MATE family efflux protein